MKNLTPYLFFNRSCREAMKFYESCFGGELKMMTFGDAQKYACPTAVKDCIMHSLLQRGSFSLMASDSPDEAPVQGDNTYLMIDCESEEEIEDLFKKLSNGGTVEQPLADMFWGARFGTLIDRFGVHWMFNYQKK